MPYLTDDHLRELATSLKPGDSILIKRGDSQALYTLAKLIKHGMKGVLWRAKDDLGIDYAIKLIPEEDYSRRSLADEMTEVKKLSKNYFADVVFFGELVPRNESIQSKYMAISTVWIEGEEFEAYVRKNLTSIETFIILAKQLFTAIANLVNNELCHDDLHPGNVLIEKRNDELTNNEVLSLRIIDTGTIKRPEVRRRLLDTLKERLKALEEAGGKEKEIAKLSQFLDWKEPDDHLRAVGCLLIAANAIISHYNKLDFWERKFIGGLKEFFIKATDHDLSRRLDSPETIIDELLALSKSCQVEQEDASALEFAPFDYISAEMIRNDKEFTELFSKECPWLKDCESLQPLYIYGPRGCGKSSVLRWLAFKTILADPNRQNYSGLRSIGIYVSCSVELRSRFWLLNDEMIDSLQVQIVRYFNFLLLEELFDTLALMWQLERDDHFKFGFTESNERRFAEWVIHRISNKPSEIRLQGQSNFHYLKGYVRRLKWGTWSSIKNAEKEIGNPDPSILSDICREMPRYFSYFSDRHVVFLIDDYSNQRIPAIIQKKLNQTISFAKQGTPIFKVSSEYNGVDLEGIQEGREVVDINIGEKYTSLVDPSGPRFLTDIVNIRLLKAKYSSRVDEILGKTEYEATKLQNALAEECDEKPFYYHGIDCIHWLCSGDVALALDLIKKIFDKGSISKKSKSTVQKKLQHNTIQQFSYDEIRRIRYIVPFGEKMYDIVCYLGALARVYVQHPTKKRDRAGEPRCVTHLDIRQAAIRDLQVNNDELFEIYGLLTSRAILFTLQTSRSRIEGATERLQLRRIYLPAFKAPLKRDSPIKIDSKDELVSLLNNPKTFVERELRKSDIDPKQLSLVLQLSMVKPGE